MGCYMTPTHNEGGLRTDPSFRSREAHAESKVRRIADLQRVGDCVYKIGDDWYRKQMPTQTDLDSASIVLRGGRILSLTDALVTELATAGITMVRIACDGRLLVEGPVTGTVLSSEDDEGLLTEDESALVILESV